MAAVCGGSKRACGGTATCRPSRTGAGVPERRARASSAPVPGSAGGRPYGPSPLRGSGHTGPA